MLKSIRNNKRSLRVRRKIKKVSSNRYRISIHRSTKNIFAQIIDDVNSKTLVSASSLKDKIDGNKKKMDSSAYVAKVLAKKAIEKKITRVYFDRGSYKYHGRVKIFAETLRKNGLTF